MSSMKRRDKSSPKSSNCCDLESIDGAAKAELHFYVKGGHGFGMRKQNLPTDHWIERFVEWMQVQGFIKVWWDDLFFWNLRLTFIWLGERARRDSALRTDKASSQT